MSMVQFIETEEGVLYPVSRIQAIRTSFTEERGTTAEIEVDGEWHATCLRKCDIDVMLGTVIVPTEHFQAVFYNTALDPPDDVHIEPIIAFALTPNGFLVPILTGGASWAKKAILRPDGKIETVSGDVFHNLAAFQAELRAEHEHERDKQAVTPDRVDDPTPADVTPLRPEPTP